MLLFRLSNCSFISQISEDVTSFDQDFYNEINSVLADYGLPMKLTAKIVRIVSFSFNYCSQKINEHI